MIKEKVYIMPKIWQVSAMIDTIYKMKDIIISAGIRSGKSLPYQLIPLIKEETIILVVLPIITLIIDQLYLSVIIFYYKLLILSIIVSIIIKIRD